MATSLARRDQWRWAGAVQFICLAQRCGVLKRTSSSHVSGALGVVSRCMRLGCQPRARGTMCDSMLVCVPMYASASRLRGPECPAVPLVWVGTSGRVAAVSCGGVYGDIRWRVAICLLAPRESSCVAVRVCAPVRFTPLDHVHRPPGICHNGVPRRDGVTGAGTPPLPTATPSQAPPPSPTLVGGNGRAGASVARSSAVGSATARPPPPPLRRSRPSSAKARRPRRPTTTIKKTRLAKGLRVSTAGGRA